MTDEAGIMYITPADQAALAAAGQQPIDPDAQAQGLIILALLVFLVCWRGLFPEWWQ